MGTDEQDALSEFYVETTFRLRDAFAHAHRLDSGELANALNAMCTEAHFRKLSPQAIELAMRITWAQVDRPSEVSESDWTRAYHAALGRCLSSYFATPVRSQPR